MADQATGPEPARPRWGRDLTCAALLVGLGLAVRLPGLSTLGLYRDDAWPMLATRTDLRRAVRIGVTTPGFEAFVRAWGEVSTATLWVQAPALAASLASVALAYHVARRLDCGRAAAAAAGGVLALAPVAVLYATRVKPYAFDALGCLLLLFAAIRVVDRPTLRRWTALAFLAGAAPLFSASVLPVGLSAVAWTSWRVWWPSSDRLGHRWATVAVPAAYAAVLGVYALVMLSTVPPSLRGYWAPHYVKDLGSALFVLQQFAAGMFLTSGTPGVVILAALAAGAWWARPLLAPLLVGPVAIAFGLAVAGRAPFGGGRTDLYLYPCVALALALTVEKVLVGRSPTTDRVLPLLTTGAIVVFAVTSIRPYALRNPYPGADMAELSAAVLRQAAPGDGIVVGPFGRYAYALYSRKPPEVIVSSRYSPGITVASTEPDVLIMPAEYYEPGYDADAGATFARGRARVWYLATDTPPTDTSPDVQENELIPERRILAEGFVIERRIDVAGAHADLLVRPGT